MLLPTGERTIRPAALLLIGLAATGCTAGARDDGPDRPGGLQSLNGRVRPKAPEHGWSFLVGGHLYGSHLAASHPARTFRDAIPAMNRTGASFLVSAGDCFFTSGGPDVEAGLAVFGRLDFPVYNAPGNHDLTDRAAYVRRFGRTWDSFDFGGCRFILLDTEIDPWNITGPQLDDLRRWLEEAAGDASLHSVFVFSHRVIFASLPEYLEPLGLHLNSLDGLRWEPNFRLEVVPLLRSTAARKKTFWFSGDVGAPWSDTLFFHHHTESGVTFVATGLGDLDRDLMVKVEVGPEGSVRMTPLPLGNAAAGPIEQHDPASWKARFQ